MASSSKRFAATNTRNICIVGHVDHGKSSYADSLLAANNIISARMAGKMRYLDSREDEQERGITMESSAVSLSYRTLRKGVDGGEPIPEDYMINLIDTPGHVDFSSEVSTASRLCDGALVMVDAVEGVCTQTITVLRQAWMECLKPILVINKMDRLITELKLAPIEAHHHLSQLVEQVNAVMGSFHASERMEDDLRWREERARRLAQKKEKIQEEAVGQANVDAEASTSQASASSSKSTGAEDGDAVDDEEEAYEERDDEDLYFAPEQGNVLFSSAIDGWAFRISQFAQIHAKRLGIKETNLRKVLWGDFYLDPKTKRVLGRKHLGKRALKPMFVQFVLENIWAVYDSVVMNHNMDKITKIIAALGVKIRPQDLKTKEHRSLLNAVLSQWLPLASATFRAVVEVVPAPPQAQAVRIPKMLHPELLHSQLDVKPQNKLEEDMYQGRTGDEAYTVAYVSKMFAVPAKALPQNQKKPMTAEEMRQRGRASREAAAALAATGAVVSEDVKPLDANAEALDTSVIDVAETPNAEVSEDEETLLGFSRLYSGTMKAGQTVYALLPKYNAALPPTHPRNSKFILPVKVDYLYMMMGRDLVMVDQVPAGNVFAISGLEGKILRNGTLCGASDVLNGAGLEEADKYRECFVNLAGLNMTSAPIVRVALEPREPSEMPKLVEGLRLLNQADSCVETLIQETGEHVILTAGELHLERCLRDLRERFAKIEIQASPPIVPFRETAIQVPDMAATKTKDAPRGTINGSVLGGVVNFTVRARPLPTEVTQFLISHSETVKKVVQIERDLANATGGDSAALDDVTAESASAAQQGDVAAQIGQMKPAEFWKHLDKLFAKAGKEWTGVCSKIWTFGPRRVGPNILVDNLSGVSRSLRTKIQSAKTSKGTTPARASSPGPAPAPDLPTQLESEHISAPAENTARAFDDSIDTAFQLSTLRGPLCNEPVQGMAYFVEKVTVDTSVEGGDTLHTRFSQVTGSLIASAQEAFRNGLLDWSPRLLLAMYSCDIQASTDVLGKVYGVVARRRGRIVSEEMKEGTSFFTISALLPVVESFSFADEIRKRTSGAASPQLVFHGYELLDEDPFWVPTTEEELEDLGEKADRENIARRYMDNVRKRKGLFVEKKVVEHAEKQRTLKR